MMPGARGNAPRRVVRRGRRLIVLAALVALAPGAVRAALPRVPRLSSRVAWRIAQAAASACRVQGYHVSVAIMDEDGVLRQLVSDDGVRPIDIRSARAKARSAITLGARTGDMGRAVAGNPGFGQVLATLAPGLLLVGGGVPIVVGGVLIGAVGVGGAPDGAHDEACADAGITHAQSDLK